MYASALPKLTRLESEAFYGAIRSIGYISVTKSPRLADPANPAYPAQRKSDYISLPRWFEETGLIPLLSSATE
jgi:hypothetical protein